MSEKNYKKRFEFQNKMISRQSEQIDSLKSEIEKLNLKCDEKDKIINSVTPLRNELTENIKEIKEYKRQYRGLIDELRNMKEIMNQEVFGGRWWLIRLLLK